MGVFGRRKGRKKKKTVAILKKKERNLFSLTTNP